MSLRARWVLACVLGETLALALSALLGAFVSRLSDDGSGVVVFMPLVGAVEGAVLGAFQAWALKLDGKWIAATSAAIGGAWLIGALGASLEPQVTSALLIMAVASLFGVLVGTLVGWSQRRVSGAGWTWVVANIAGWVSGLLASALLSEAVPWGPFTAYVFAIEALKGAAVGLCLSLVTAPYLNSLFEGSSHPKSPPK